jgi:hypothetical protein
MDHQRTGQPPSWEMISRIALVLSARTPPPKHEIDRFVEKTGKFVEVFYVETDAKKPTYSDWRCFTRADADGWKLPKKKVMQELASRHYDLVLNVAPSSDRFAVLLGAMIPAGLLCSSHNRYKEADLVISSATSGNVSDYLSEVLRYLQMIRA